MKNFRQLFWFVAGSLLISLLANFFLISEVRTFYAARLAAEISPAGPPATPSVTGETNHFSETVLLYGDSRMAVWKFPPPPGIRLVNAAVGGATTAQLRLRLPPLLDEFRPDVVVVQAGINDLKLLGVQPELEPALVGQTYSNLMTMVHDSRQQHAKVMLLLIWPPGPPEWQRRPFWNQRIAAAVATLNHQLSSLAASPDVGVVDLLAEAGMKPSPDDYRDALHFQPAVYQRLTPALLPYLGKISSRPEPAPK